MFKKFVYIMMNQSYKFCLCLSSVNVWKTSDILFLSCFTGIQVWLRTVCG